MNDPRQYLLHLTSRGNRVRNNGDVGQFINYSKQPIKDINKFGLMHYSIPKMIDPLSAANNTFNIRLEAAQRWTDGFITYDNFVDIPVTIPLLDYINTAARLPEDTGTLNFQEVLQTTINWAMHRYWDASAANRPAGSRRPDRAHRPPPGPGRPEPKRELPQP